MTGADGFGCALADVLSPSTGRAQACSTGHWTWLEVVNAGPNAVLAIAVHDYEPGDSAAFFLKVTSDNSGSDWHDYEVRPKVDGTRCFGVAATGKHAKGTHRDMRNMQRPPENAPPDGWFENDFDDEAWSAPTRPTCADWAERHGFVGCWFHKFKYTFYRINPAGVR